MKSKVLLASISGVVFAFSLAAQDTQFAPKGGQIPGPRNTTEMSEHCCAKGGERPASAAEWKSWIADLRHWRTEHLIRIGYDGAEYDRPELKWTQSSFMQPQMMAHDRFFYHPLSGTYTVARYLDDLKRRYGGIDSVLVWPTYPNIGVGNRNQFDLIRDMPGGVQGLKAIVEEFHRQGVRVLFPGSLSPASPCSGSNTIGWPVWSAAARKARGTAPIVSPLIPSAPIEAVRRATASQSVVPSARVPRSQGL